MCAALKAMVPSRVTTIRAAIAAFQVLMSSTRGVPLSLSCCSTTLPFSSGKALGSGGCSLASAAASPSRLRCSLGLRAPVWLLARVAISFTRRALRRECPISGNRFK